MQSEAKLEGVLVHTLCIPMHMYRAGAEQAVRVKPKTCQTQQGLESCGTPHWRREAFDCHVWHNITCRVLQTGADVPGKHAVSTYLRALLESTAINLTAMGKHTCLMSSWLSEG